MSGTARIAIRGANWLGDSVISIPAVRAIRALFPGSAITMLAPAELAELWEQEGSADRVLTVPRPARLPGALRLVGALRREKYDLGILFTNSFSSALFFFMGGVRRRVGYATDGRSILLTSRVPPPPPGLHQAHRYLRVAHAMGPVEYDARPSLRVPEPLLAWADAILRGAGFAPGRPVVGINAGSAYGEAKCWPVERFAALARMVRDRLGAAVVAVGGARERGRAEAICSPLGPDALNAAGETTVMQCAALAGRCGVFVSNDTGPMHLAAAVGTPVVAIFGPTDPGATAPLGERMIVRRGAACAPCTARRCPADHRCMTAVTAEDVFAAVKGLHSRSRAPDAASRDRGG